MSAAEWRDETYFSKDNRYELGRDRKTDGYYAAILVTSGVVDYYEYYGVSQAQYDEFMADEATATVFIEACRRRERDDLLLQKPGWNRGVPM